MTEQRTTQCCIVGGGPAGMMLGFLLARAGVEVVVLEKHADFLRDFRGDTIHPSTLELMHELGLLEEFLKQPHQELQQLVGQVGDTRVTLADFSGLPTRCNFIALMPQWDFLNFLAAQGHRYKSFDLCMKAEATDLIRKGERITGVRAVAEGSPIDIRADLVVAADGRHSTMRVSRSRRSSGAPRIPREWTSERGASGAGCFGTQKWRKTRKSRSLSSSSARAASTNATRGAAGASGDLPQAGDQSRRGGAGRRAGERGGFAGYGLDSLPEESSLNSRRSRIDGEEPGEARGSPGFPRPTWTGGLSRVWGTTP